MAITLVGTASGTAIDGGDATITLPAMAENDVVYVFGGFHGTEGTPGVDAGEGYASLTTVTGDSGDSNVNLSRLVQGAIPDTSIVCLGSGNVNRACAYVAIVLRGVNTSTPEDATATTAQGAGDTARDGPAIDTVTNAAWVLTFAGISVDDATITAPTNYINLINDTANDTADFSVGGATLEIAVAGTEDPGAWSTWGNQAVGNQWAAITVAVRPATSGNSWYFYSQQ